MKLFLCVSLHVVIAITSCSCRVVLACLKTVPRKQVLEVAWGETRGHTLAWKENLSAPFTFFCTLSLNILFYPFPMDVKSQPTVWTGNASDQSNDVQAGCLQCRIQYGICIYIISTLAKIAKFHSSRCKIGKTGAATVTSCYFEAEEWPCKPLKCRVLPNEQNSAEKVSNRSQ